MKHETFPMPEHFKNEREGSRLAGGFLVIMGGIFLLAASGATILGYSPWLLAALLPVYWIGACAYKHYKEEGRISRQVVAILGAGLFPFAFVAAAMLGFNVSAIWPVGLIAIGVSFILLGSGK